MQASEITPVGAGNASPAGGATSTQDAATSAFGLGFDSLLKIILTQLTYQDPLKPMDNFEFVSQLAQFSQVQQGQVAGDRLKSLVAAEATNQATGLLGRIVDVPSGARLLSGKVVAVTFAEGATTVTVETADKQTISGVGLSTITQIREK